MAERYPHIFLEGFNVTVDYKGTGGGTRIKTPTRGRSSHSTKLLRRLERAWKDMEESQRGRTSVSLPVKDGMYLEFKSSPGYKLKIESLENLLSNVRLLNVRSAGLPGREIDYATVFIPAGKEQYFLNKIQAYAEEVTNKGNFKNADLVNSIDDIQLAVLESFWQDDPRLIPDSEPVWCEVWLRGDEDFIETSIREIAGQFQINAQEGSLRFPDRTVVLAKTSRPQLIELIESCSYIAEFRRAKETAKFFLDLQTKEQSDWVDDLLSRLTVSENPLVAVTILDSGANNGHALLAPILADEDCHSYDPTWGVNDHHRHVHGTLMCGVAGYGDLQAAIEGTNPVNIPHCLESVKILPPVGENDFRLYGDITIQGVTRAEIQAPRRIHIPCMAITARDTRDRGRPTSWSAAIDKLTSGHDHDENTYRNLFIVAAGNIEDQGEWSNYHNSNITNSIHDPGQSWNALTVGAFTEKVRLTDPDLDGHEPVAAAGELSPFSTTSLIWENKKWPVKPDIVMEGGNLAKAPDGSISEHDDLSILSTSHKPTLKQFDFINATSASTARAAWMTAQIQASYPNYWPETVRGLMVHSAEWTPALKNQFMVSESKTERARLLRFCGYGVPNMDRAIACSNNSLTLIAQQEIQPFDKKGEGSGYRTKDMHLHTLPWPKDVLLSLGEVKVTLRVTLSYFIEPGPGEIGWKDRYRYASHALRFDLNNVNEDDRAFIKRLNAEAREEGEKSETSSGSERWEIGANGRNYGSIHSDFWEGYAADLASCNLVGVYPIIGWWRERPWRKRWNRKTRYSLIVSLNTPELTVDLYTPVAIQVGIPIAVTR